MIRNFLTLLAIALLIALAGTVWAMSAAASLSTSAPWAAVATYGAAGATLFLSTPWLAGFTWNYTRRRGRHAAPKVRSRSRYIKIKEG